MKGEIRSKILRDVERRTITGDIFFEIPDLGERRILPAGAEEIAQTVQGDTAVASLVEQAESLLVVGRSLVVLVRHDAIAMKTEKWQYPGWQSGGQI